MKASDVFIHPTSVVDAGADLGEGVKVWHFCHISAGAKIGAKCKFGQNVFVADDVTLGENVKVQNNVSIYSGVSCADDVFLGPSMVFTNVINPRSAVNRRGAYAKTWVGKGASIGANATIVCGNNIGEYAFIGAGAVVTTDVPAYALLVGVPAKQAGWVSRAGCRLDFSNEGLASCPEGKEVYRLQDGKVECLGPDAHKTLSND